MLRWEFKLRLHLEKLTNKNENAKIGSQRINNGYGLEEYLLTEGYLEILNFKNSYQKVRYVNNNYFLTNIINWFSCSELNKI